MAIQYSGNAQTTTFVTSGTTMATDYETALVAALVAAGWVNTPIAASSTATFAGQPANNDTITIGTGGDGQKIYTFKTSLAGCSANAILIDASLTATIDNLKQAIIGGPGSGTKYCAGTTAHTTITVTAETGTTQTYAYHIAGSNGNGAALASSSGNITFSSGTLTGGKNVLLSALTPQGLRCNANISTVAGSFYNPGTTVSVIPGIWDNSVTGKDAAGGTPPATTTFRIIANKYQFITFIPGSLATNLVGNGTAMGALFITSNLVAPTIVTATNAAPISCNLPTHGFTTGQSVLIVNGTGNTAINGQFVITVTDVNNFTLNGSTGNGSYVGNSASCANLTIGQTIDEAIWSTDSNAGGPLNWRNGAYVANNCWTVVNRQAVSNDNTSARPQIVTFLTINVGLATGLQWYDNSFVMGEPFVAYGISSGATPKIIGQLWDAALIRTVLSTDQTAVFDSPSHNFWAVGIENVGDGGQGSLMFATT